MLGLKKGGGGLSVPGQMAYNLFIIAKKRLLHTE